MTRFAEGTTVSVERTQAEIELLLRRRGADQVIRGWDAAQGAVLQFRVEGRFVRLTLPAPDRRQLAQQITTRTRRTVEELVAAEERRTWRALLLLLKAKLEAIDAEISTFEREFLPDLMLPDGRTVIQTVAPAITVAYDTGRVAALLPAWEPDEARR